MAKPIVTFLIACCLFLSSCYREKRVKPVEIPKSASLPYEGFIVNFKHGSLAGVDSNGNGSRSSFDLQIQLVFNRTTKFKYTIFLENSSYNESSVRPVATSDWLSPGYNFDYIGKVKINADSLLDFVLYDKGSLSLSIKFEDEYGRTVRAAPASPSTSTSSTAYSLSNGKLILPPYKVETTENDQKFNTSFSYYFLEKQDQNLNSYAIMGSRLQVSFYQLPPKPFSVYVNILFSENYTYPYTNTPLVPFAHSEPFLVTQGASGDKELLLHYDTDIQQIASSNAYFLVQILDAKTGEKIDDYGFTQLIESPVSDKRTFSLSALSLKEQVDHDGDSYASSYQAAMRVAVSDSIELPFFAKVFYKAYGQSSYNPYTNVVWSSNEEAKIALSGNTYLAKGEYDFKIELYAYDAERSQSKGNVLATFSPDNTPSLQAIKLEKISEDVLP